MEYIAITLIGIAAIAKGVQDLCKINAFPDSWTWWNESDSWRNKWDIKHKLSLYEGTLRVTDNRKPRFFGSTTFLVWVTDGWHFFQMVYLNSLMVGFWLLAKYMPNWWWLFIMVVLFKVWFESAYSIIKKILKLKS